MNEKIELFLIKFYLNDMKLAHRLRKEVYLQIFMENMEPLHICSVPPDNKCYEFDINRGIEYICRCNCYDIFHHCPIYLYLTSTKSKTIGAGAVDLGPVFVDSYKNSGKSHENQVIYYLENQLNETIGKVNVTVCFTHISSSISNINTKSTTIEKDNTIVFETLVVEPKNPPKEKLVRIAKTVDIPSFPDLLHMHDQYQTKKGNVTEKITQLDEKLDTMKSNVKNIGVANRIDGPKKGSNENVNDPNSMNNDIVLKDTQKILKKAKTLLGIGQQKMQNNFSITERMQKAIQETIKRKPKPVVVDEPLKKKNTIDPSKIDFMHLNKKVRISTDVVQEIPKKKTLNRHSSVPSLFEREKCNQKTIDEEKTTPPKTTHIKSPRRKNHDDELNNTIVLPCIPSNPTENRKSTLENSNNYLENDNKIEKKLKQSGYEIVEQCILIDQSKNNVDSSKKEVSNDKSNTDNPKEESIQSDKSKKEEDILDSFISDISTKGVMNDKSNTDNPKEESIQSDKSKKEDDILDSFISDSSTKGVMNDKSNTDNPKEESIQSDKSKKEEDILDSFISDISTKGVSNDKSTTGSGHIDSSHSDKSNHANGYTSSESNKYQSIEEESCFSFITTSSNNEIDEISEIFKDNYKEQTPFSLLET